MSNITNATTAFTGWSPTHGHAGLHCLDTCLVSCPAFAVMVSHKAECHIILYAILDMPEFMLRDIRATATPAKTLRVLKMPCSYIARVFSHTLPYIIAIHERD